MGSKAVNGNQGPGSINFDDGFVQIIDGKSSPTKESRHGVNPANLKPKASVPLCTKDDLDRAAAAGKKAFLSWSKVPYEERRSAVLAYADAVAQYREDFRNLLTSEQGKPVSVSFNPRKYGSSN
jgi:acyl-CoA reductase-like NAD-dependent aldehyde dehydrogenase